MPRTLFAVVATAAIPVAAAADLIDFETDPSGLTPVDNTNLSRTAAYNVDGVNVTFGFDSDGDGLTDVDAQFEQQGGADPIHGFVGPSGAGDTAAAGFEDDLGGWFLRSPDYIPANWGTFVIEYDSPVDALSGEIWDIDGHSTLGTEQWAVRAYDSGGTLLGTQISPLGVDSNGPYNGAPWVFSFNGLAGATRVELEFIGTKEDGAGLGFNNYSATTAVPAPGALATLAIAGLAGGARRRRS